MALTLLRVLALASFAALGSSVRVPGRECYVDEAAPASGERCPNDCCGNGVCTEDRACLCDAGFTGDDCGTSECTSDAHPQGCENGGQCKFGKCHCNPGFEGDHCQLAAPCAKGSTGLTCNGHGVCRYGKCFCNPGWDGDQGSPTPSCETQPQCTEDCSGHGVCSATGCICLSGFTGDSCSTVTSALKCQNDCGGPAKGECRGGFPVDGKAQAAQCYCNPGWQGADCTQKTECPTKTNEPDEPPCDGHGECKYGKCFCHPGWEGISCSLKKSCQSCLNGVCQNGHCYCHPGWAGDNCDQGSACPNNCNEQGFCNQEKCYCYPGFSGEDCGIATKTLREEERLKQCADGCNNHGICGYGMWEFSTGRPLGRCLCQPGYSGESCETAIGCPGDCNGHGECVNGVCVCSCGYKGPACDRVELGDALCPQNCNDNGECVLGECYCNPGFTGDLCEKEKPCPEDCHGNGECQWGKCFCHPGFEGESCEQESVGCADECSAHGMCCNGFCFCESGFVGEKCDIPTAASTVAAPSARSRFLSSRDIDSQAMQPELHPNNLEAERHDHGATPTSLRFKAVAEQLCVSNCSSHGICAHGQCFCDPGFQGDDCASPVLCPGSCADHGICQHGRCFCDPGFRGDDCSVVVVAEPRARGDLSLRLDHTAALMGATTRTTQEPSGSSPLASGVAALLAFCAGVLLGVVSMWFNQVRTRAKAREILKDPLLDGTHAVGRQADRGVSNAGGALDPLPPMPSAHPLGGGVLDEARAP